MRKDVIGELFSYRGRDADGEIGEGEVADH